MLFRSALALGTLAAASVSAQSIDSTNDLRVESIVSTYNFTVPQEIFERQLQQNPEFDMYVLQMYWWAGHCAASGPGIPLRDAKNSPPTAWNSQLVVHGLWPGYSDEFKAEKGLHTVGPDGEKDNCAGAAYVPPSDLNPNARAPAAPSKGKGKGTQAPPAPVYFLNLPNGETGTPATITEQVVFPGRGVSTTHKDFYKHEYEKHGKCSGLTQAQYFAQSVALGNRMNAKIRTLNLNTAKTIKYGDIQKEVGFDSSAIACNSNRQLWFINFCFSHDGQGRVGEPTRCPTLSLQCVTKSTNDAKNVLITIK